MGRKKEFKRKNGTTAMTYVNHDSDDVTVIPVDSLSEIKVEEDDEGVVNHQGATCHLCNRVLKNKYALKAHMITHASKNFKCDECGMMFATTAALSRHNKCKHMDVNLRPFPCHMCELRFLNKSHLATHLKTHTGERDVTCALCFAAFYSKADLVRHMKGRHLNIRSFTCHICNKGFFRKSYLKVHLLNIHMQPTDVELGKLQRCYACRYCKKIFLSRTSCYSHERSHNGAAEQRSLCTMCGKTFSRPSSLKKHMEKHGGTPKHRCGFCDRPFFHLSSYKRHLNIHNRPDPDVCQVCGTLFTNKDAFRRHLRKHVARGEMESLPPSKDEPRIMKLQELLTNGGGLDDLIKTCNMELIQMGSKKDNYHRQFRNFSLDNSLLDPDKDECVLYINEINSSIHSSNYNINDDTIRLNLDDNSTIQDDVNVEHNTLYQHDFTIISNDFKTIFKNFVIEKLCKFCNYSSRNFLDGRKKEPYKYFNLTEIIAPMLVFTINATPLNNHLDLVENPNSETINSNENVNKMHIKHYEPIQWRIDGTVHEVNTHLPSYVRPDYYEDNKPQLNVGTAMLEMYNLYNDLVCEKFIDMISMDHNNIFEIRHLLDKNLNEMFELVQITRRFNKLDLLKAFEIYDNNVCSWLEELELDNDVENKTNINEIHIKTFMALQKVKGRKFKIFRTNSDKRKNKKNIIVSNGDFLEKRIESIRNDKNNTLRIKNISNLIGNFNDNIGKEKETNLFDNLDEDVHDDGDIDDYDDFPYDDDIESRNSKNEEIEMKPQLEQLEEKVFCEPSIETIKEEENNVEVNKKVTSKKKKKKMKKKKKAKKKKIVKKKKKKIVPKVEEKEEIKEEKEIKMEVDGDSDYDDFKEKKGRRKGGLNQPICTEFVCSYCEKLCATKGTLKTHIFTMHMMKRVCSCDICGMSFIAKSRLETHVENVHLRIRRYQCTQCEWAFYARADLDRHERRHTGVKPFMCHVCSKTFVRKAQLKSHIAIHSGERKFMCNHCGKSFITRSTLVTHLKRHSTKPFVRYYKHGGSTKREKGVPLICPTCGKVLSTAHSLKRHIESVHEKTDKKPIVVKEYPCPQCPLSFSYKTSMQRHMHKVHKKYKEPRNYSCPICARRLLNESSVLKHMIKRHPYNCDNIEAMTVVINKATQRTIPCPLCKRKFQKQTGLEKHLVKKHYYTTEEYETLETQIPPLLQPTVQTHIYVNPEEKTSLLLL